MLVQNLVNKFWQELVRNEQMFGSQLSVDIDGHDFDLVTKNRNIEISLMIILSFQTNTSAGKIWHARQLSYTDRYQAVRVESFFHSKRIMVESAAFQLKCDGMTSPLSFSIF